MHAQDAKSEEIRELYGEVSAFELKDKLIELAKEPGKTLLDAGRGNPNWTASTPRDAFFTFGHFAVEETRRTWAEGNLAGMPKKKGIANRFYSYVESNLGAPGVELLKEIIDYGIKDKGYNADDWVFELTDAIIGDNYPVPDRMLSHVEQVVGDYLHQELSYGDYQSNEKFNLFAVEGATATMCYIFDSLIANELLHKGDKIALMVPIFTPYLEIPLLPRYDFDIVKINACETNNHGTRTWQYPEEELDKLKDQDIKAVFVVNPSNPSSVAIKSESINYLTQIVKNDHKELMIISDDVYGTFVDDFSSLVGDLAYNTIGVYSFSKYFGVTGWRLGTIALQENNIFDQKLRELPKPLKELVDRRYESLTVNPESIPFIDRIVADSRQVALNHTAGLSTPQQIQMAFFSIFAVLDKQHKYKERTKDICRKRQNLLFDGLGVRVESNPYGAAYYTEINILELAFYLKGSDFAEFLQTKYKPIDLILHLAEKESVVLLNGDAFSSSEWSIRVSLANLNDEAYTKIGQALNRMMNVYTAIWREQLNEQEQEERMEELALSAV
ncbi:aspartate 4-decarboxylase [Haloplasma contractile]|uniref:Aminotransferase n=1 Tax=Haloplasma contractile SSD-17B TaxID=1033810 RepID=U2FK99_9MOLU|nr:aspartate 4-decarboxylase [Haloplasma contractile]ERJ13240.1 Aminotransferase classes I protein [Haloplasma contractile SSD-17B]